MLLPGTGRGTSRRLVEGAPLATLAKDSEDDPFKVVEHLRCRNAHGQKPQLSQISISRRVFPGPTGAIMRFAVDLDRQPGRETGEVQ
jgi:hypothetical protein